MSSARRSWFIGIWVFLWVLALAARGSGQEVGARVPSLSAPDAWRAHLGSTVQGVEVQVAGKRWREMPPQGVLRPGQLLSAQRVRQAARELLASGRFASARVELETAPGGVVVRFVVVPRRIIADIRLRASAIQPSELHRVVGLRQGDELTPAVLEGLHSRLRQYYLTRGFRHVHLEIETLDTDDPLAVVLLIQATAGAVSRIERVRYQVEPYPALRELREQLQHYAVAVGDRADETKLAEADELLRERLVQRRWPHATVSHRLVTDDRGATLTLLVRAGPRRALRFDGHRHFDVAALETAVEEVSGSPSVAEMAAAVRRHYVERGFLDVRVDASVAVDAAGHYESVRFAIREGQRVRVRKLSMPCLQDEDIKERAQEELYAFLREELPSSGIVGPADADLVNSVMGPTQGAGARAKPFSLDAEATYVPDTYAQGAEHLQDVFRSEGYLSAQVGAPQVARQRCHPHSPPDRCLPYAPIAVPRFECTYDAVGLPLEVQADVSASSCEPDALSGTVCAPSVQVYLPIKLGPLTRLYDAAFSGNRHFVEQELATIAQLQLGQAVSQVALEQARRRVIEAYAEAGFVYADVKAQLELSPDLSRARAHFEIQEREQVRVSRIVVQGAKLTNESLIRSRVVLKRDDIYRRSLVRKTEERLATLGVFSTVTVGLEDPNVPAKRKVVVVRVQEKKPQYLDVSPGFSTGEGFRITFEYGHRNLIGEAVQLTLRSQLGILPVALILEDDVRRKYEELDLSERLERRNSIKVELPEVGLGPLFRLSVEGIDVRDNSRDFGITKDALIPTLSYRPDPRLTVQLGGSIELNDASIFGDEQKDALEQYVQNNPTQRNRFRIPQGTTVAFAQGVGVSWERRNNPLDATKGTFVSARMEHVRASPVGDEEAQGSASVFAPSESQFLRWTNRLAGYLELDDEGLAFALSFRWGMIHQLRDASRTYPDRLFFMGGVDSLRSFLQDSVVPEDIARQLLDSGSDLELRQVVIRGGDAFINPRAELRIPLSASIKTALFVDAGNLWTDPALIGDAFELRYALGTGLRVSTPIGPLVFDYGLNVDRVLDKLFPERSNQRFWEELGAFHFSIGLF